MKNLKEFGFTLVEILLVLAILTVLAALIFPVISRAAEAGRRTACVSNLHEMASVFQIYATDYDGRYPPPVAGAFISSTNTSSLTWRGALAIHNGTEKNWQYVCPDVVTSGRLSKEASGGDICGYACNGFLSRVEGSLANLVTSGRHESALRYPSLIVFVFDARAGIDALREPDNNQDITKVKSITLSGYQKDINLEPLGATRHNGGANYAFGDGHVKWRKPDTLSINRTCDGTMPGFGL